jgi:hypothetical protein
MFFNKRVSYDGNPSSFGSCYVCRHFLPQKIICQRIMNNNTDKHFIPSAMYSEDELPYTNARYRTKMKVAEARKKALGTK